MADAIVLFFAFIAILSGLAVGGYLMRKSARERKELPGKTLRKREEELAGIEELLRRVDQAATAEELDRLEEDNEKRKDR